MPTRVTSRAVKAILSRPRNVRMSSWAGSWAKPSERIRLSWRWSTAESIQKGPSESSSAATDPEKSANAPSRTSVSMRVCAFFSPCLDPVLHRGKRDQDAVVAPEVPTRWAVGQAVLDHEPHGQGDHAVGVLPAGWCQIGPVRSEVLATLAAGMLRRGDHQITRTPHVEIPEVVQPPLALCISGSLGRATRTGLPLVGATGRDDLWRWQVGHRRNACGGIGSRRPRTAHGFVLPVRMLGPKLYDTCPSGAIPKPGKDAIVSDLTDVLVAPEALQ